MCRWFATDNAPSRRDRTWIGTYPFSSVKAYLGNKPHQAIELMSAPYKLNIIIVNTFVSNIMYLWYCDNLPPIPVKLATNTSKDSLGVGRHHMKYHM